MAVVASVTLLRMHPSEGHTEPSEVGKHACVCTPGTRAWILLGVSLVIAAIVLGVVAIAKHNQDAPVIKHDRGTVATQADLPRSSPRWRRNARPWTIASAATGLAGVGILGGVLIVSRRRRRGSAAPG